MASTLSCSKDNEDLPPELSIVDKLNVVVIKSDEGGIYDIAGPSLIEEVEMFEGRFLLPMISEEEYEDDDISNSEEQHALTLSPKKSEASAHAFNNDIKIRVHDYDKLKAQGHVGIPEEHLPKFEDYADSKIKDPQMHKQKFSTRQFAKKQGYIDPDDTLLRKVKDLALQQHQSDDVDIMSLFSKEELQRIGWKQNDANEFITIEGLHFATSLKGPITAEERPGVPTLASNPCEKLPAELPAQQQIAYIDNEAGIATMIKLIKKTSTLPNTAFIDFEYMSEPKHM